jgi:hypothetical protein
MPEGKPFLNVSQAALLQRAPGVLVASIVLSTLVSMLGFGWNLGPVQALSLVRWSGFGQANYQPIAAEVTVMSGQIGSGGGEFEARPLRRVDWERIQPGAARIRWWQVLTEAPLRGEKEIGRLWEVRGEPTRTFLLLGVLPQAESAAVLIENRAGAQKWLYEFSGEEP